MNIKRITVTRNRFIMIIVSMLTLLFSCSSENKKETFVDVNDKVLLYDSLVAKQESDSLKVYIKNDSLFFVMSDRRKVAVPWNKKNFHSEERLRGIYTLTIDGLEKQEVLRVGERIFYTILDEQYRGQMYVISLTDLTFYRDEKFNRDFLISNSGMYLLDKDGERLIVVDRPVLDEKDEDMISPFFVYEIKEKSFRLINKSSVKES
jgi:hypothetical protein